jgi:argininosuccinate synthase
MRPRSVLSSERALALGAARSHVIIDARDEFFDRVLKFLIMGNVRRGQLYPLCVGAERGVQARHLAGVAAKLGANTVAHGCTAAGNDQVRFEVILKTLAPELEMLAPVRDHAWAREDQLAYLKERNLPVPKSRLRVLDQSGPVGRHDRRHGDAGFARQHSGIRLGAEQRRLRSTARTPMEIESASSRACRSPSTASAPARRADRAPRRHRRAYAIGRGIHLGDTILGTKGRVAFEAPAAEMLLNAHRELEKLTLTGLQMRV